MLNLRRNQDSQESLEIDLKVQINNTSIFYLASFPTAFKDLEQMIEDKIKPASNIRKSLISSICVYYIDDDDEKISISDDSDLMFLLKRLSNTKKNRFKIYADFEKSNGKKNSVRFEDARQGLKKEALDKLEILKFCDFLKKKMKTKFDENFKSILQNGKLPCMECMGEGIDSMNQKCQFCCGLGERPSDSRMNLIMKLIEFKFNQLLLVPFQKLFYGFSYDRVAEDYEKIGDEDFYNETIVSERDSQCSSEDCEPHEIMSESTLFKVKAAEDQVSYQFTPFQLIMLISQHDFGSDKIDHATKNRIQLHGSHSTILPSRHLRSSYSKTTRIISRFLLLLS